MRPRIGPQPEFPRRPFREALLDSLPCGIGVRHKPRHLLETARAIVENLDNLPYAWRILKSGVCDGCSLGPRGLRDDVLEGTHLCTLRLNLLRLNTMGPMDLEEVGDIERLRLMTNGELQRLGRLCSPLIRRRGEEGFTPVGWDEALDLAAGRLRDLDPRRTAWFATSRGITNEAYYTFQKTARILGSPNIDYSVRLCHAASGIGLRDVLGVGAPTCSLRDAIGTDFLVLWGANPANNHPVLMKYLYHAKKAGTRIVVVNPFREPGLERYWVPGVLASALFGTRLMDDFYQVAAGGDTPFVNGILKALRDRGGLRMSFIRHHASGYEEMCRRLDRLSWSELETASGIAKSDMLRFASIYSQADTAVFLYSTGLTQQRCGVENVRSIATLALARGMVGQPKCGVLPIGGHSGVQGGAECGVSPDRLPSGLPVNRENAERFAELWGHPVPSEPGLAATQMVEAAHRGEIDFLYNIGGNLGETLPDRRYVREALDRIPVRIHNDIVLNTTTLLDSDLTIVLPATTRYEIPGGCTTTSTERRVRFSPEIQGPRIPGTRPEWEALSGLAIRVRPELRKVLSWEDSRQIREEMEDCLPLYEGIATLQEEGDWIQWGGERLLEGWTFGNMPGGKARLWVQEVPHVEIPEGWFHLGTRRGNQFNTMVFSERDPLNNGAWRNSVIMNAEDAHELGLGEDDRVIIRSELGEMEAVMRIGPVRRRTLQAFWPEANRLVPRRYDPASHEPDYSVFVQVRRA